jgi:hypothetical protein
MENIYLLFSSGLPPWAIGLYWAFIWEISVVGMVKETLKKTS